MRGVTVLYLYFSTSRMAFLSSQTSSTTLYREQCRSTLHATGVVIQYSRIRTVGTGRLRKVLGVLTWVLRKYWVNAEVCKQAVRSAGGYLGDCPLYSVAGPHPWEQAPMFVVLRGYIVNADTILGSKESVEHDLAHEESHPCLGSCKAL